MTKFAVFISIIEVCLRVRFLWIQDEPESRTDFSDKRRGILRRMSMKTKIGILTDTNSGILESELEAWKVQVVPMPIIIDEEVYVEGQNITKEQYYEKLESGCDISTTQPSPGAVMDLYERLLEEYEELIYIPMSSGLSGTCATVTMLAEEFGGKIHVIDNKRISITMLQAVKDAVLLRDAGWAAGDIARYLREDAMNASIYVAVDTLKYLKKGGRVTPAGAAIGEVLNIKPVLQIQGDKLDAFAKVRGIKAAHKTMFKALEEDKNTRFAGMDYVIMCAYSGDDSLKDNWVAQVREYFGDDTIPCYHLPLSITTHVGPGAYGIGIMSVAKAE